jgi:hypothetical protein
MQIWVRVGDAGDYQTWDGLDDAIEYLNELNVGQVVGWIDSGPGVGVETVNYHGLDFISLYWGDKDANLTRSLNRSERSYVAMFLEEVYI